MMGLLCPVDMSAQTFLLLLQGLFLFAPDAFAAHDHHDGLIARLFAVRRAARRLFPPFALHRAELFSALTTSRYRCHALLVVCLGLFSRAENIVLRDESRRAGVVRAAAAGGLVLFVGFEGGELPLCSGTAPVFDGLAGGLYS